MQVQSIIRASGLSRICLSDMLKGLQTNHQSAQAAVFLEKKMHLQMQET